MVAFVLARQSITIAVFILALTSIRGIKSTYMFVKISVKHFHQIADDNLEGNHMIML